MFDVEQPADKVVVPLWVAHPESEYVVSLATPLEQEYLDDSPPLPSMHVLNWYAAK